MRKGPRGKEDTGEGRKWEKRGSGKANSIVPSPDDILEASAVESHATAVPFTTFTMRGSLGPRAARCKM